MPRKQPSPLVEAAQAFDDALEAHARASELFTRSPLASTKQIDRANELLGEIAAAEERLRDCGAALSEQITAARDRQLVLAQEVVARLPSVKERNEQLLALLEAYQALGTEAGSLNASARASSPKELAASLLEMSARASTLAGGARDAGFDELSSQAHALHQRLAAAAKKLQGATLG